MRVIAVSRTSGTVSIIAMPGDCNGGNGVTPGAFTSAINRFMGRAAGSSRLGFCSDITVTPGYFDKILNAFIGR